MNTIESSKTAKNCIRSSPIHGKFKFHWIGIFIFQAPPVNYVLINKTSGIELTSHSSVFF